MKYEDVARPYAASYGIIRQAGKIAFLLRENTPWMNDHYGLPSGRVDKVGEDGSESFLDCLIHELREEVDIEVNPKSPKHVLTMHRFERDQNMVWVDVFFEVTEWEGELRNAEPHKHSSLDFLNPRELPEKVVPSVRFAIASIEAGKTYVEYGFN